MTEMSIDWMKCGDLTYISGFQLRFLLFWHITNFERSSYKRWRTKLFFCMHNIYFDEHSWVFPDEPPEYAGHNMSVSMNTLEKICNWLTCLTCFPHMLLDFKQTFVKRSMCMLYVRLSWVQFVIKHLNWTHTVEKMTWAYFVADFLPWAFVIQCCPTPLLTCSHYRDSTFPFRKTLYSVACTFVAWWISQFVS